MSEIVSRPYQPDPKQCCEACVWGRGPHAEWCQLFRQLQREAVAEYFADLKRRTNETRRDLS